MYSYCYISNMNKLPAQPNKSLIDGITVLQEVAGRGRPVSGLEIAAALGLEKTRVNRMLKTLAWLGMVRATPDRKYIAGERMHILAAQSLYASGLLRIAIPYLEDLHKTGLVVALGVIWRDRVSYFYHHNPGMETINGLGSLSFYPAGSSSIGMVLLAQQSDDELAFLFAKNGISDFTGSLADLMLGMKTIRDCGYADILNKGHSLAVAITPQIAIALSGVTDEEQIPVIVTQLKNIAAIISKELYAYQQTSS